MNASYEIAPKLALEIGATIGYGIARRALWFENRCVWFDAIPAMPGANPATSATSGVELYGGTSGIALFLAQLEARTGDATFRRTAKAAMRHALERIDDSNVNSLGFYAGKAGVGAAAVLAGRELDDDELIESGRALLQRVALVQADPDANDLIGGTAGTLVSLVIGASQLGDAHLLNRASEAATLLIALGNRGADGKLSWSTMRDKSADLTGFGHGSAGNAHALLALYAVAPDETLREAILAAIAYESASFSKDHANWPDYRSFGSGSPLPTYTVAWCHGAVGIVRSRLLAESLGFPISADVDIALATTARQAEALLAEPSADLTLCHGLFGSVDALLDGVRSSRHEYAQIIARIAEEASERHHRGERPWPSGLLTREQIDGLMMGTAGIGHVYLRLADPSLESVLAPGTP